MCFFGGDGGAGEIARQQRADEVARQRRIAAGMQQINAIFDGTPYNPISIPPNFSGFFGGLFGNSALQSVLNNALQQPAMPRTGGFNDAYYAKRAKAYTDYATPQLDRQYKLAKDNMIYALDRSGILNSSAAINKNTELSNDFDQSRLDIANKAQEVANQARQQVEGIRSNLVTQLNATGDNVAAANAAMRQAEALNQPQLNFSPLSGLFANFTDTLGAIGSNARNNYGGFFGGSAPVYSTSGSKGSSSVVGG